MKDKENNKEKKTEFINKLITKAQKGFRVRGVLSIVLWGLFAVSVVLKLRFNKGLVSCILCIFDIELRHCLFFYPDALGEIAKTIGVFSLFIVWIYAELGKCELGWQYTDLLATFCRHYHLRALSYILAILACIYIATIDILESASFAMLIAVLGLWDQTQVLVSFIFNSSVRKELAIRKWDQKFTGKSSGNNQVNLPTLHKLADNISVKDSYFDNLCECMANGIKEFMTHNNPEVAGSNRLFASDNPVVIINISHIWERLLDGRPNHERSMLLYNVLKYIDIDKNSQDNEDYMKERLIVCAGYLLQEIRYYKKAFHSISDSENKVLIQILSDINQLKHKQGTSQHRETCDQADIIACMDSLFATLVWMHFLCNNIILSQELQIFLSYYNQVYSESFKSVFGSFIQCIFDEKQFNLYFNTAWTQVGKP